MLWEFLFEILGAVLEGLWNWGKTTSSRRILESRFERKADRRRWLWAGAAGLAALAVGGLWGWLTGT